MSEQRTLDLLSMSNDEIQELITKMLTEHAKLDPDLDHFYYAVEYFILDSRTIIVKYAPLIRRITDHVDYMDKLVFTIKAKLEDGKLVPVEVS